MIHSLKGMKDILDANGQIYEKIIKTASSVASKYGYTRALTPHLESTSLFYKSVGENTDIVGKEMYEFTDKGENEVALRPEGTAGMVRAYLQSGSDKAGGIKRWFYHGSMFRYERPQLGRLREFHQFGVECFGQPSVYEDASVIFMLADILDALGISAKLHINSLGCTKCMSNYRKIFIEYAASKAGFCKDCTKRLKTNPIRMLDCKNAQCKALLAKAPKLSSNLCLDCKNDYLLLQKLLSPLDFVCDDSLVRGLDYYSKTAFEFLSSDLGAQSALAGGGRYDKLLEQMNSAKPYAIGFAIGVERIMHILKQREFEPFLSGVYVCAQNEDFMPRLFALTRKIRQFTQCELANDYKKLGKAMKNANAKGFRYFVFKGEDEEEAKFFVKDFAQNESFVLNCDELLAKLQAKSSIKEENDI